VIAAQRHRTQARNRQDALDRLVDLIRRAAVAPRPRRPTRPTAASRERRIETKKRRAGVKGLRRVKPALDYLPIYRRGCRLRPKTYLSIQFVSLSLGLRLFNFVALPSMPKTITQYRVFIGSPGGLKEERERFRELLEKYTRLHSEPRGVTFFPVGWEDTIGG